MVLTNTKVLETLKNQYQANILKGESKKVSSINVTVIVKRFEMSTHSLPCETFASDRGQSYSSGGGLTTFGILWRARAVAFVGVLK